MKQFVPLGDIQDVICILAEISLFGGTTDAQLNEIFRRLEVADFKKGECVFQKGDEPTHIYIVERGVVELEIPDAETMIEKKALKTGECFGHAALMSMHQHRLTAVAVEDSRIIVLSRRAFMQLRHEDIELYALLMMNIARELARRLMLTDELLLQSIHSRGGLKNAS